MENIKKYIIQQTIINNMNNNQITFLNSIISDIDKTHNIFPFTFPLIFVHIMDSFYQNNILDLIYIFSYFS